MSNRKKGETTNPISKNAEKQIEPVLKRLSSKSQNSQYILYLM